jgi:ABC-type dipeptide/oligopeptide/nickel transport system permease component
MQLWVYVVRRLILLLPVLIGVTTITFAIISALPTQAKLSEAFGAPPPNNPTLYQPTIPCTNPPTNQCPNPVYQRDVALLGLDKPIPYQWGLYVVRIFTFQWGNVGVGSTVGQTYHITQGQPVTTVLGWFLPYTLELAILSLAIIMAVSLPLGNAAAVQRNRPVDQAARVMSFSGFAFPGFLLSSFVLMGAIIALGSTTHYSAHPPWCAAGEVTYREFWGSWPQCVSPPNNPAWLTQGAVSHPTGFPTVDALLHGNYWLALDTVIRMLLPALVIAYGSIAVLLRFVRNSMLEVMNLDFVRTARAGGVPEATVIKRHAGRNSLNVTVTVLGLTFAFFVSGFPVIEYVFGLNGIGLILALSVENTTGQIDLGLVFGSTLLFTYIVVAANILVDILYAYLDPRVRLG